MADTTFVNGTVIEPEWLNDVNDIAYGIPSITTAAPGASLVGFIQDDANAVATNLSARGRKWVLDTDFDTIQHAFDYCASFDADAPTLFITQQHTLSTAIILNRASGDPLESKGRFVIQGLGKNSGFTMTGVKYMFENNIVGFSENIVFQNIWFGSDHSDNGAAGFTGVLKVADFIRVTFRECYFQEVGIEPSSATYAQSIYLDHCKFVSWNGPIMSVLAFYDLSVIGCQFESGSFTDSKGFVSYDATAATSTQKAAFISNLYENCTGSFVNIQNGRGVVVTCNYFEDVDAVVLDFTVGAPLGVFVNGNGFDSQGQPNTYGTIAVSRINGFFGSGNWASTRLYTIVAEVEADGNDQGGSIGIGDSTTSGELLSTSSASVEVCNRLAGGLQLFRLGDEAVGSSLGYNGTLGGTVLESVNRGSAVYLPWAIRQRNNAGTRNQLSGQADGTAVINILGTSPTLTENLSMAMFESSTTQLRFTVRCSDGVTRTANLTLS